MLQICCWTYGVSFCTRRLSDKSPKKKKSPANKEEQKGGNDDEQTAEFRIIQTYHDGLLKLQAKEYGKAQELLENVLEDPLVSTAQAENTAGDGHLLQLRFLALKNLATVFLRQGSAHYESALRCYVQAVEIDTKDSVVWNQLGTLSCEMDLLSMSRWAFEQGLLCRNCMEKLLEVLIAIGDEVSCLSLAELILRHWPSHPRALYVKSTIEESERIPFAPRGIDKLVPEHARLKFLDKRKAAFENSDEEIVPKRVKQTIEVKLEEVSWTALVDVILGILRQLCGFSSQQGDELRDQSPDTNVAIRLPSYHNVGTKTTGTSSSSVCNNGNGNEPEQKEVHVYEEQSQERRSSRLGRLRSHKPGKEEKEQPGYTDLSEAKIQSLECFVIGGQKMKDFDDSVGTLGSLDGGNSVEKEYSNVVDFVKETSKNWGAYHLGHMLLEKVAIVGLSYQQTLLKFLELEKLTRHWACDRTPECSLFLAELYNDIGRHSSDANRLSDHMSEASYHLCKVIESVSLDCPLNSSGILHGNSCAQDMENSPKTITMPSHAHIWQSSDSDPSVLSDKTSFWVRFFWLSGHISMWEENMVKAFEEFSISLSLLENSGLTDVSGAVCLPYCKVTKELTINLILRQIHLLQAQFLMNKKISELIEKEMYTECIDLLAPLLFTTKPILMDPSHVAGKGELFVLLELSVLDILIESCEKVKPLNFEIYLKCHLYKLQMLMMALGMGRFGLRKQFDKLDPNLAVSITESKDGAVKCWIDLIVGEVKALSRCASEVKNWIDQIQDLNGCTIPTRTVGHLQLLLLDLMVNIAKTCFCKRTSGVVGLDQAEQKQRCCFIDAAIAFCKLQHLDLTVPTKTQVALIGVIHDLLAEYGICCVGDNRYGIDGTFLKLAIKHLLALDMELKSYSQSSDKGLEANPHVSNVNVRMASFEVHITKTDKTSMPSSNSIQNPGRDVSSVSEMTEDTMVCGNRENSPLAILDDREKSGIRAATIELSEAEREELEDSIDNVLDQCFFCLYGLNLRSESSYDDDLSVHKNTNSMDYQSKEQCADVFTYILPYAMASTKTGLLKLRRVLRAIHKHFPQPPDDVLVENPIDKFLDDPSLCEDKLWEETASDEFVDTMTKVVFPDIGIHVQSMIPGGRSEPYLEVYRNLFFLLAQSEETSATDKWTGFVLTKEGEEFVQQSANLFKYDLLFNPLRFESWQRLANIYDEDVDLLLNDGSKHINAAGWRKNPTLPQRVETSRRRSRRCLLMSLALAKTSDQQGEIHEMLALVYYDSVQNVVPFYDQRAAIPSKDAKWRMFCQNSMKHFKQAFVQKPDWSHAFYLGKLCEKLGMPSESSLSYYQKAIALNPSAVDAVYRMHASRLKMLSTCERQDIEVLKVAAAYCHSETTQKTVLNMLRKISVDKQQVTVTDNSSHNELSGQRQEDSHRLVSVWHILYNDCLSALQICVEGDLKHFHKARYMLAQGLYRRGDLEKAKEELSFCFKSSRSSFTVNMWEIDGMVKKGRRKAPAGAGSKKILEVNLPESSRKFITCIRKYLLFYLKLLEETGDINTLDRAYASIRGDKRFSLCLEDLVPVALGRYLRALVSSIRSDEEVPSSGKSSSEQILEKMFCLFMEQGSLWSEVCSLPEIKCPEFTESTIYGYLHQHVHSLENSAKLEILEAINEKIRKRFKNPKLSHSSSARVCKHASIAWCRSLIIKLSSITPLQTSPSDEVHLDDSLAGDLDKNQVLYVDLQTNEFWNPSFTSPANLANLQTKWDPLMSKIKNVLIKKTSKDNMETANSLLRSAFNFYRDSSSAVPTSGVNLYLVPAQLATTLQSQPASDGIEMIDLSIPRKLLLWAYTLLHGRYTNVSAVVKYCEENAKSRVKVGAASSSPAAATCSLAAPNAQSAAGSSVCGEAVSNVVTSVTDSTAAEATVGHGRDTGLSSGEILKMMSTSPQLHRCDVSRDRIRFDLNDDAEKLGKS
ncbi:Calcineurin-binding protein 1-like protein [Drosera capensis]